MIYNAGGIDAAQNVGALNYVGSEEAAAGKAGGEFFGKSGQKNVLCVNTLPGAANTEARCKGIADGIQESGGKSSQLPLPSSKFGDPTAVSQAIKAALLKDGSIDGLVTISAPDANSAAQAIKQGDLGDKVKLGTFDLDPTQLERIKGGEQLFAIDQQPYMQGYLAVSMLNCLHPVGDQPAAEAASDGSGDHQRRERRRRDRRREGRRPLAECGAPVALPLNRELRGESGKDPWPSKRQGP